MVVFCWQSGIEILRSQNEATYIGKTHVKLSHHDPWPCYIAVIVMPQQPQNHPHWSQKRFRNQYCIRNFSLWLHELQPILHPKFCTLATWTTSHIPWIYGFNYQFRIEMLPLSFDVSFKPLLVDSTSIKENKKYSLTMWLKNPCKQLLISRKGISRNQSAHKQNV